MATGNFHVEKFSWNDHLGTYHVNINSAHVFFVRLIFVAATDYDYNENFQIMI